MGDRALRLRLGLLMGVTLILLAGLVVLFGGAPQLFSADAKNAILFPEAPGIGPGTPIRKSGVRIGQVTALELDPVSGQVRVRIAVDRKYLPRHSERAEITRLAERGHRGGLPTHTRPHHQPADTARRRVAPRQRNSRRPTAHGAERDQSGVSGTSAGVAEHDHPHVRAVRADRPEAGAHRRRGHRIASGRVRSFPN